MKKEARQRRYYRNFFLKNRQKFFFILFKKFRIKLLFWDNGREQFDVARNITKCSFFLTVQFKYSSVSMERRLN